MMSRAPDGVFLSCPCLIVCAVLSTSASSTHPSVGSRWSKALSLVLDARALEGWLPD